MADLEGLRFVVESKSEGSAKGIEELANNLKTLKFALGGKGGTLKTLEKLAESLSTLQESSGSFKDLAESMDLLGSVKISPVIGKNLEGIAKSISMFKRGDIARVKSLASAIGELATNLNAIKGTRMPSAKALSQASVAGDDPLKNANVPQAKLGEPASKASAAGSTIGKLVGHLREYINVGKIAGTVSGSLKKAFSVAMSPATKFATEVKNVTARLGQFFGSIKRIAMYRAIRAMFSNLSGAIREGTNNIYQYSTAMGGTFKSSMDSLASSFQYLKNSMGSVAAPIINLLGPAIDYIIGKITTLLNLLAQLFARLSGATHYTAAKKAAATYGAAAGKASGAAKELKKSILSFDEIHKLDDPRGSGGGGGGGGGGGFGDMFEERPIDAAISEFADRLRAAFDKGDWKTLGTLLGNKFNEIIDNIPWASLGKKFGYGVNGLFETIYYTLHAMDFRALGADITTFLNNALNEINTDSLGRLVIRKITAVIDLLIGAINTLDFGLVGNKFSNFFVGMFSEASEWIQSVNWSELTDSLFSGVYNALVNINWSGLATSLGSLATALIEAASSVLGSAVGSLGTILIDVFKRATSGLSKFFKNDDGSRKTGTEIVNSILKGIEERVKNIGKWIKDHIFKPFIDGLKSAFGDGSVKSVGTELVSSIGDSIKQKASVLPDIAKSSILDPIKNKLSEKLSVGISFLTSGADAISSIAQNPVTVNIALAKKGWTTITKFVGDKVTTSISLAKKGWSTIKAYVGDKVTATVSLAKSGWSSLKGFVGSAVSAAVSLYKSGWTSLANFIGSKVSVGISLFKSGWTSLKNFFGLSTGGIIGANGSVKLLADGGVLSAGAWNKLPKYAAGTNQTHGTVFVAGEAGPEVVGHANGRTEVLNKSQMAMAVYSGMVSGMKLFSSSWNDINRSILESTQTLITTMYECVDRAKVEITPTIPVSEMNYGSMTEGVVDVDGIIEGVREGVYEASGRQNELLREQNAILRELLNKEVTAEFTTSSFTKAIAHKNLRDGVVGTPVAL